jgi:hypothetical protein
MHGGRLRCRRILAGSDLVARRGDKLLSVSTVINLWKPHQFYDIPPPSGIQRLSIEGSKIQFPNQTMRHKSHRDSSVKVVNRHKGMGINVSLISAQASWLTWS